MPKHPTPKQRREMVAAYRQIRDDMSKTDAYRAVGEEFGFHAHTVAKAVRNAPPETVTVPLTYGVRVEALTSSDYEPQEIPQGPKTTLIPITERTLELIGSDIHFPYEDRDGYQLFFDVAVSLKPQILVLLGDILDCYAVSAHDKDANRATPAAFKEELIYARAKLNELRDALPKTRIIYKEGNHETRLSRYIQKNAAALSNLRETKLDALLGLKDLDIEWIANDERLRIGRLWHIHGNEIAGGGQSPARLKYQRMQCNFVFGHHHQRDKFRPRAYDGSQHGAWGNPCLCRLDAEYLHHAHNWSLGFTLVDHDADGSFQVEETEVIKTAETAKCNVRGKIYTI